MAGKSFIYTFIVTVATPAAATEDDPDFYNAAYLTSPEGIEDARKSLLKHLDRITGDVVVAVTSTTLQED